MHLRTIFGILVGCLGLILFAGTAQADTESAGTGSITFNLVKADLTGNPGSLLIWQYDVTNNSGEGIQGLYVNGGSWLNGNPDSSVFDLFGGPGSKISDGNSLIGILFYFTADTLPPNSFNSGMFDLGVSLDDGKVVDLFAKYTATISPTTNVPEPGTLLLLASGLLAGFLTSRRAAQ
jgi:hypothetical protein